MEKTETIRHEAGDKVGDGKYVNHFFSSIVYNTLSCIIPTPKVECQMLHKTAVPIMRTQKMKEFAIELFEISLICMC